MLSFGTVFAVTPTASSPPAPRIMPVGVVPSNAITLAVAQADVFGLDEDVGACIATMIETVFVKRHEG